MSIKYRKNGRKTFAFPRIRRNSAIVVPSYAYIKSEGYLYKLYIKDSIKQNPITLNSKTYYMIYTLTQLKEFRDIVNGSNGYTQELSANALLMNDIDLNPGYDPKETSQRSSCAVWTPIGNYVSSTVNPNSKYAGEFNGLGNKISGIYTSLDRDYNGLFGYVASAGKIMNLEVDGVITYTSSTANSYAGGIAGYNCGSISNCTNDCTIYWGDSAGGIVGETIGSIVNSLNNGLVNCINNCGGLAGVVKDTGSIRNSINVGNLISTGSICGGITGYNYGGSTTYSVNNGYINGSQSVGGIVGSVNGGTATNCYQLSTSIQSGASDTKSYNGTIYESTSPIPVISISKIKYMEFNNNNTISISDIITNTEVAIPDYSTSYNVVISYSSDNTAVAEVSDKYLILKSIGSANIKVSTSGLLGSYISEQTVPITVK